ncbi:hypothetical protein J056_003362 [Wallemia ichthyophaga EXF-994]|uniref:Yeast cell wall synthesis Kre9/Knh1-like N-terminal domain-containing protein n=1 Tax=Wallemia ichthyophaga (strain EXF-994 / CBS 113033) TaxID=1299270 RepID=R9AL54_WALI9|nr:uncharacterized protein J056_003362 [Wallemia ichthyophaga EXF-994]EOR02800.1 hypothetical protein J056_003362 [Wallemia ichthyophaga EXF-994]
MFESIFALSAIASTTLARLSITQPISGDTIEGGEEYTVEWVERGEDVTLSDIGQSHVYLYAGNDSDSMVPLTQLGTVDATEKEFNTTIDPEIGQNGTYYTIRVVSDNLQSQKPEMAQYDYPYIAYSDIFELTGMTGTFNETLLNATGAEKANNDGDSDSDNEDDSDSDNNGESGGDKNNNNNNSNGDNGDNGDEDDDSSASKSKAFAAMGATILGAAVYLL